MAERCQQTLRWPLLLLSKFVYVSISFLSISAATPASFEVRKQSSCEGKEVRFSTCKSGPCDHCKPVNCLLRAWSDWSAGDCTGLCERQRGISQANNNCGQPCQASFIETKKCATNCHRPPACPSGIDCVWNEWSDWSACTCTCGGGQKTRDRHIKVSPEGSGQLCAPQPKTQVAPCATQPCSNRQCIDGNWGEWGRWGKCTATCGGGLMWRTRSIVRQANECGKPASGDDRSIAACNTQPCSGGRSTDCLFGSWTDWSDCSCTCNGVKRRSRRIARYGRGPAAKSCQGATKQVAPCHLGVSAQGCASPAAPIDCAFGQWNDWSSCQGNCGFGQRTRARTIVRQAKGGGKACGGVLSTAEPCQLSPCVQSQAKDCLWDDWGEWSSCDKCGGQRKRFRHIKQMAENGGDPCKFTASEEAGKCLGGPSCHQDVFCAWGDWEQVTECSASCGEGTIRRVRYMKASPTPPVDLVARKYEEGKEGPKLAAGFAAGRDLHEYLLVGSAIGCVVTLFSQWAWQRRSQSKLLNSRQWSSRDAGSRHSEDEAVPLCSDRALGENGAE